MGVFGDAYDAVAGTADHLAGSTDEAFSRQFDSVPGGGLYDGLAGTADHLAGSTDEAFARQFDDVPGGGFADYDTWAGIADHAAGSTDEWVGQRTGALKLATYALVAVVVLYLARPLFQIGAALAGGDG